MNSISPRSDDGVSFTIHYYDEDNGICIERSTQNVKLPEKASSLEACEEENKIKILLNSPKTNIDNYCSQKYSELTLRTTCLLDFAIAKRDPTLCEKIKIQPADSRRNKCFTRVAELTGQEELCEQVVNGNQYARDYGIA